MSSKVAMTDAVAEARLGELIGLEFERGWLTLAEMVELEKLWARVFPSDADVPWRDCDDPFCKWCRHTRQ